MSRRQDYIARVRYMNTLPPPPCQPKLLESNVNLDALLSAGGLSSTVLERDLNPDLDMELGMPIDLTEIPHAFDPGADVFTGRPGELDPEDQELLVEPAAASGGAKKPSAVNVSFLRRTEYISMDGVRGKGRNTSKQGVRSSDPEAQLQAVEESFDKAQEPLTELKHPKKKNVTAVRSLPLLPDLKQFDLQYFTVRMMGSASLNHRKDKISRSCLEASLFNNCKSGDQEDPQEWMSFYAPGDDQEAQTIVETLHDTRDAVGPEEAEDRENKTYVLEKVQDYDMDFVLHDRPYDELVVSPDKDTVFYVPVRGRATLKRRRVDVRTAERLKDHNFDAVEYTVREVTPEESITRDALRSSYDPVTYSNEAE